MANPTYRQWLQSLANIGSGLPAQEASALLQVVGDDFGVNQDFISDPYKYTNTERGQVFSALNEAGSGENVGYGPQGIQSINDIYKTKYNNKYSTAAPANKNNLVYGGPTGPSAQEVADETAYWNDQLQNADTQIGRLDKQQSTGESNIDAAYNSAYGRLTGDKARTQRDYNTTRQRTIDENISAKGEIDTSVRNTANGLQRLLGSRGAGASSAAQILAPYAAAVQGSEQRGQVQKAFGQNLQGLDTSWKDYEDDWNTSVADLGTQRDNNKSQLLSGIAQTRADLLEAKSNAEVARAQAGGAGYSEARGARVPYTQKINDLLAQIDSYGATKSFTPKTDAYKAPELASYTYDRYAAPSAGVNPNAAANAGAYWTLLGDEKKRMA